MDHFSSNKFNKRVALFDMARYTNKLCKVYRPTDNVHFSFDYDIIEQSHVFELCSAFFQSSDMF